MKYVLINKYGEVVQRGENSVPDPLPEGLTLLEGEASFDQYWDGENFVDKSPQPSFNHVYDASTHTWVDFRTLSMVQESKWQSIKSEKESLEVGGFLYLGHIIESDEKSFMRMLAKTSEAQTAINDPTWSVDWTTKDNSVLTMNAEQMLGMVPAFSAFGSELHRIAQEIKVEIFSPNATIASVEELHWPTPEEGS